MSRVWLVTGVSRGIGAGIAREVAQGGGRVAVLARSEGIFTLADEISAAGGEVLPMQADVTDAEAMRRAVEQTVERWERIDVLVNNAGIHRGGTLERIPEGDFEAVLAADLVAPFLMCRLVVPHMPEGSAIVNIGSVVGLRGFPGDSAYGAAKAGLAGLTRVLAIELAPRGITVNLVVPGLTETEILRGVSDRSKERMIDGIPLRRLAQVEEIARVVCFVAATPYMTGSIIAVDGGLLAAL